MAAEQTTKCLPAAMILILSRVSTIMTARQILLLTVAAATHSEIMNKLNTFLVKRLGRLMYNIQ